MTTQSREKGCPKITPDLWTPCMLIENLLSLCLAAQLALIAWMEWFVMGAKATVG